LKKHNNSDQGRKPLTNFVEAFACSNYDASHSLPPKIVHDRTRYEGAAYQYEKTVSLSSRSRCLLK